MARLASLLGQHLCLFTYTKLLHLTIVTILCRPIDVPRNKTVDVKYQQQRRYFYTYRTFSINCFLVSNGTF